MSRKRATDKASSTFLVSSLLSSWPLNTWSHSYNAGIFESILSINPELGQHMVSKTTILPWLIKRIESKAHDGNRVYAAEILSILLDNRPNRLAFGEVNGVESALTVLSVCSMHL